MSAILVALSFLACSDYGFVKEEDAPTPEWGYDTGYTIADTGEWETTCPDPSMANEVGLDESCLAEPVKGPIDVVVEWSIDEFDNFPDFSQVLMTPVVGQMSDDDGDGDIDKHDIPDIVIISDDGDGTTTGTGGVLRVLSGDGTSEILMVKDAIWDGKEVHPYRYSGVALGDIDRDGSPDMVMLAEYMEMPDGGGGGTHEEPTDDPVGPPPPMMPPPEGDMFCRLVAFNRYGDLMWGAWDTQIECGAHSPAVADLDGDGDIEVVIGPIIISGTDGSVVAEGSKGTGRYDAYEEIGYHSVVGDLNGDGFQEVVAGKTIYDPYANEICSLPDSYADGFTALADLNEDGEGEVVLVGDGSMVVFDINCTVLSEWWLEGEGTGGPPTVADFDADGSPEIAVASDQYYSCFEANGDLLWNLEITDASSHATGSSVFDFEGDGRPEVLYADEVTLWILDGTNGGVRLENSDHTSRTIHEYPTVADVDGDGMPEIIVTNGGGHWGDEKTGLYVLGSADGSWIGERQVWNQHAYSITNIEDDLSIPSPAIANWPDYNSFRSGDLNYVAGESSPDAVPIADVCTDDCDEGWVVVDVRVGNEGTVSLRNSVPVTAYAVDGDTLTAVKTVWTSSSIEPTGTSQIIRFRVFAEDLGPDGLLVKVDDAVGMQVVRECHEDNNEVSLDDAQCD